MSLVANEVSEQTFELRRYLAVLRARKLTIILTTLLVVGAVLLFSWRQTPLYHAEARVLVHPLSSSPVTSAYPVLLNLETERQIAASAPVAARVAKDLKLGESPTQLLRNVEVNAVTDSEVVTIGYTSPSAARAKQISNSFALHYIQYRKGQALESLLLAQGDIKKRIDTATSHLGELASQISDARNEADEDLLTTLDSERTALIAQLGVLQERFDSLQPESSITVAAGDVIQPAFAPLSPSSPNYQKNGGLALFLGLGLGVFIAFMRERLDDRFRDSSDLEQSLGVPVLATVPKFKVERARRKNALPGLIVSQQPQGVASEAFRALRTNLQFVVSQRNAKTLVVTSASSQEGKTSTTSNLGMVFAKAGKRVVLISADMRKPTLEKYFGVTKGAGLSMWLAGADEDMWDVAQDASVPNLKVVSCGPVPPNPAELLTSPRFVQLVEALEKDADVILIDSPPILPVADASIMASKVGGVILVINSGVTSRSVAIRARAELERAGVPIIGTVLNAFQPSSSSYYYQPYYRGEYANKNYHSSRLNGGDHLVPEPSTTNTR